MIRRTATLLATFAALAALAGSADAQSGVRAGVLECRGVGSSTFIIAGVHEFECAFRPDGGAPIDRYRGVVRKFGLDLGVTGGSVLGWAVFAPTNVIGRGALAGTYGGVTAGATVGVGASANVLVGGSGNTISLQPLSLEGQTGLNVSAGVASFELFPAR